MSSTNQSWKKCCPSLVNVLWNIKPWIEEKKWDLNMRCLSDKKGAIHRASSAWAAHMPPGCSRVTAPPNECLSLHVWASGYLWSSSSDKHACTKVWPSVRYMVSEGDSPDQRYRYIITTNNTVTIYHCQHTSKPGLSLIVSWPPSLSLWSSSPEGRSVSLYLHSRSDSAIII